MMSSSTKTVQLEDLEFYLGWKTRDEIIGNLNQHTALLSGLTIDSETREKLKKVNRDLVAALMDLPVKGSGRSEGFESLESGPNGGLNEFVLYLSSEMKTRIVETLMANQHVILLGAKFVSSERKSKLIDENIDLGYELLKLKVRTGAIPSDSSTFKEDRFIDSAAKTSESQTDNNSAANEEEKLDELDNPKSSSTADEMAILKDGLEQLRELLNGEMISNLKETVQDLEEELAESKEELAELKSKVHGCRSETTIIFSLKGIEALLAAGSSQSRFSKDFTCGGMSWYLEVRRSIKNEGRLGVFLYYHSPDLDRWSVATTYEVRLLSSGAIESDLVRTIKDYVFKKDREFFGYGWPKFITFDELSSGSFIQDDTIKFRVHLTTKNFERIVDL